jgi:hypothetical protein
MQCEDLIEKIKEQIADETKAPIDYELLLEELLLTDLDINNKIKCINTVRDIIHDEKSHKDKLTRILNEVLLECRGD